MRRSILISAFLILAPLLDASPRIEFLQQYCIDCHGAEKQKGDYRFDTLTTDLSDIETLETWQNILDQLNLGEMPPRKSLQPSKEEWSPVVHQLTEELSSFYAKMRSTGGRTVIRRLNRHELRNTLRDLLYLDGPQSVSYTHLTLPTKRIV